MKVLGYVEVYDYRRDRFLIRARNSTVSICRENDISVILIQQPANSNVLKYQVTNNIEKVNYRFVVVGKAIIRLEHPRHEIRLHNDAVILKCFLGVMHRFYKPAQLPISPPVTRSMRKNATVATICPPETVADFNRLPPKTKQLEVTNIDMDDLPQCAMKLQQLCILVLSNVGLQKMPNHLTSFPHLTSLALINNSFNSVKYWDFLGNRTMQQQLKLLDLRHNELPVIPPRIGLLQQLNSLKLDQNRLLTLPHTFHHLKNLRYLTASDNKIQSYPHEMFTLKQVSLDISGNPHNFLCREEFKHQFTALMENEQEVREAYYSGMKSLKELSSRVIHDFRLPYKSFGLPECLVRHLDEAKTCYQCGRSCFGQFFIVFGCGFLRRFIPEDPSSATKITTHYFMCSQKCTLKAYPKILEKSDSSITCYLAQ